MRCVECGTYDQFDVTDGAGYCQICGTQSQQIREEVAEFDETVVGYEIRSSAPNKSVLEAVPDVLWTKEEALQYVIQQQVNALVKYGYPATIKVSLGNLWFRFLAVAGRITIEGVEVRDAAYVISPRDNLVLLYLAMRRINIPLFLSDTIEWVTHGVMRFINASSLLPSHFKPKKLFTDMNPKNIPDFEELNKRLVGVMKVLSLPDLVECNAGVLCIRLSEALGMPDKVGQLAGTVFESSAGAGSGHGGGGGCEDVRLLASFVTAVRLHYQFENTLYDKREWRVWLKQYLTSVEGKLVKDMTTDPELLQGERRVQYPRLFWQPHTAYFLHMQVSEYLTCINNILNDMDTVQSKGSDVVKQLCEQFNTYSLHTVTEHKEGITGAGILAEEDDQSAGLTSCRLLLVYPDSLEAMPLELRMLLVALAARHKVLPEVLFESVQGIAKNFKT